MIKLTLYIALICVVAITSATIAHEYGRDEHSLLVGDLCASGEEFIASSATDTLLDILDKGCRDALHLKTFIGSLVEKMSKPKGRNDELSYLSTQVVFEYLRLLFGSQVNGLVFPSVQTGDKGTNVVLFPESSVVSAKNYRKLSDYKIADFEPEEEEPFEDGAMLYCLSGSLRFHKITAIKTKAHEYTQIGELFMNDLDKSRSWFL